MRVSRLKYNGLEFIEFTVNTEHSKKLHFIERKLENIIHYLLSYNQNSRLHCHCGNNGLLTNDLA